MQIRHPEFSCSPGPRRDVTPSVWRPAPNQQPALPPLMFERLSFLADLDVIEHFNFDAWYAAIEDTHQLSPVEIK